MACKRANYLVREINPNGILLKNMSEMNEFNVYINNIFMMKVSASLYINYFIKMK